MNALEVLSQLKQRILTTGSSRDARNELIELAGRMVNGECTTGDPLVDKLLYVYEARFVHEEEEILRAHRELEEKFAGHVGHPVMVVQSREKKVHPRDTGIVWNGPDSQGSYLIRDHHIHFGILSDESWTANDQDMLIPTERHVFGSTRERPDAFKMQDGGMPGMLFWANPIPTRILVGDDEIREWFRRHIGREENRVAGLHGYLTSLFDEGIASLLERNAGEILSLYAKIEELEKQQKDIQQDIVAKLHANVPIGLARRNPSLYERVNYWKDYWPPLHLYPEF
jgi:hypothetical protein